jgi:cell division protein FtsB
MSTPLPVRQSSPRPRRAAGTEAVATMRRRIVRGGMALVFVLALVDGVFGARGLIENRAARKRNAQLSTAIDEFRAGNGELIEEIKRLREDPAAIEELARDELELMKDGELLIILRDAPASDQAGARGGGNSAETRPRR